MVLDRHRDRLDWWLVPLAKAFRNVDPNTFTWISLVAALGAGVAFWQSGPDRLWLVLVGWGLVWINGVLDVLDGKVANMTGRATPKGDYLDHAIDRFADASFIIGIAMSPWARLEVGLLAVVFTLLTSYLGTQAQAVGIGRNYGGLLGRADRMVMLLVLPLVHFGLETAGITIAWSQWSPSLLDSMLIYFAAVGAITTVQRFAGGLRSFGSDGQLKD